MQLVRISSTIILSLILWYNSNIWFPFLTWPIFILTTVCISWKLASVVCKHVILKFILPQVTPDGKAVLVTGCDSGFGLLTALALNEGGFFVFAGCLSDQSHGAKELLSRAVKSRIKVLQMDVTKSQDVSRVFDEVRNLLQESSSTPSSDHQPVTSLHAIINNAGVLTCGEIEWSRPDDVSDHQKMLDVNLLGLIRVTRTFLPLLRKCKGRVINLTSIMSRTNVHSINAYCVSKTAAAKFTDGLQEELHAHGVTSISVEPYFFATPLLTKDFVKESMRKSWINAPNEVRDAYGNDGYQDSTQKLLFMCTDPKNVNQEPGIVVDALMDAVTSFEPSLNYRVIDGNKGSLFWLVNDILPFDVIPLTRRALHRLIPVDK